jgi:large conductance mechanosensitive channel
MPAGDWRANGIVLREGVDDKTKVMLKYGDFLGAVLDFFLVAVVLFLIISKLVKAAEGRLIGKVAPPKECPFCCEMIPAAAKRCKFCAADMPAKA